MLLSSNAAAGVESFPGLPGTASPELPSPWGGEQFSVDADFDQAVRAVASAVAQLYLHSRLFPPVPGPR